MNDPAAIAPHGFDWVQMLAQGGIGAILLGPVVYILFKILEGTLKENTKASLLQTQAAMVIVLSLKSLDESIREMASKLHQEADESLKRVQATIK
jgi:tRNA(Met) C34 N-acetyltransferase TmcA